MNVPDRITLQLIAEDPPDLGGVIVSLTVTTGRRNPRRIYFPKTDVAGRAELSRDDFVDQFADATESDLMGSWGNLADALPEVQVGLYDPGPALAMPDVSLAFPLLPHEQQRWPSRAAEYEYRTSCRNLEFVANQITVDLHATSHIQLRLARRSAG